MGVPTGTYRLVCTSCNLRSSFASIAAANQAAIMHNNKNHGGSQVAYVEEIVV